MGCVAAMKNTYFVPALDETVNDGGADEASAADEQYLQSRLANIENLKARTLTLYLRLQEYHCIGSLRIQPVQLNHPGGA